MYTGPILEINIVKKVRVRNLLQFCKISLVLKTYLAKLEIKLIGKTYVTISQRNETTSLFQNYMSPKVICPVPRKTASNKRKRKGRKSELLSGSPYTLQKEIWETAAEDGSKKAKYRPTVVGRNLVGTLLSPYITSCV